MSNDSDRIRLAEAMGWKWSNNENVEVGGGRWISPRGEATFLTTRQGLPFDPFADAGDDHAALQWIRGQIFSKRRKALNVLDDTLRRQGATIVAWPDALLFYKVGDYARTALTIVDRVESRP